MATGCARRRGDSVLADPGLSEATAPPVKAGSAVGNTGPGPGGTGQERPSVRFAHNSERQFARLLDFYEVAWEYEPVEFTLEWDRQGVAIQAFRPDFYLPAYDLYIEITTLNQKLVTKKNRKVRRLRELHPEVQVKILYQRDYLNLLVKFGLEEPSQLADAGIDEHGPAELPLDLGLGGPPAAPPGPA